MFERIRLKLEEPPTVDPGVPVRFSVLVDNGGLGAGALPPLGLSCHLYDQQGAVLQWDFPRVELTKFPPHGRSRQVSFELPAQPPGRYVAEFDLVHEGQFWCSARGLAPLQVPFVVPGLGASATAPRSAGVHLPGDAELLAEEALGRGELELAERLLRRAFRARPDSPGVARLLSRVAGDRGQLELSRELLAYCLALSGSAADPALRSRLLRLRAEEAPWVDDAPARQGLRLLFVAENMLPPTGGAELNAWYLLRAAVAAGHEVTLATVGDSTQVAGPSNVTLLFAPTPEAVEGLLRGVDADVVLSQGTLAAQAASFARRQRVPHGIFLQSYELLVNEPMRLPAKLEELAAWVPESASPAQLAQRELVHGADALFSTSRYVDEVLHRLTGRRSHVFHQLIDLERTRPLEARLGGFLMMNQVDLHKGSGLFTQLAQHLPNERFATVGRGAHKRHDLPNLHHLGSISPRLFYSLAEILLVPVVWPEPFGRLVVEAFAAGVPVIAARRGGLPEVAGDAALLLDSRDPAIWADAVRTVLVDGALRERLVAEGRKRATRFEARREAARLLGLVEKLALRA